MNFRRKICAQKLADARLNGKLIFSFDTHSGEDTIGITE